MKVMKLSLAGLVVIGLGSTAMAADNIKDAFSEGKLTGDVRAFYFNGDRDNRSDRVGLSVGGILKYESGSLNGLKVGIAYFSSHDQLKKGLDDDDRYGVVDLKNFAGSTEMVNSDGSSIDTLGEAYLQYTLSKTTLKIGRQRLSTPLMNDYYNRFLPNSFEAIVLTNKDLPGTVLTAGLVKKWKYKGSDEFIGITDGINDDEDVTFIGAVNKSVPNTKIKFYGYHVPENFNTIYLQADNSKLLKVGDATIFGSVQYLNEQDTGNKFSGDIDTYMIGAKLGVKISNWKLTGMYDKIGNDTIIGSGTNYSSLGWSKFINFTDIQINGEALNAGAESYGAVLGYNFGNGFKPAIKYVHIEQDAIKQLASDTTKNRRPSSDEWNIDIKYKINKESKVRVRYAIIDYASNFFDAQNKSANEFDENNLRIIYDYHFSL